MIDFELTKDTYKLASHTRYGVLFAGLILGLHQANERRCYKVTPSLIGWVQT